MRPFKVWPQLCLFALLLVLAGCAPNVTRTSRAPNGPGAPAASTPAKPTAPNPSGPFNAAFSDRGVIWVAGGQAYLARAPRFQVEKVAAPARVADVAWSDGDAWIAVPAAGWAQRVTGVPVSAQVGRVVKLSSTRAYRENGSAVSYSGGGVAGLSAAPSAVTTGGDGRDYALQGGKLYRVDPKRVVLQEHVSGLLVPTPGGAWVAPAPTAYTQDSAYRLLNGKLQRLDVAGVVRAQVSCPPGLVGVAGNLIVAVSRAGGVRVFQLDLSEVRS